MEQKTEIPGIYKVSEGVLINKDKEALAAYKLRKKKEQRVAALEENIQGLKEDIEQIKMLLRGLVK